MSRLELVQVLLRLLGVYLAIEGIAALASRVPYGWYMYGAHLAGQEIGFAITLTWVIEPIILTLAGLYLAIGGHWVIEKLFMPTVLEPTE